MNTFKPALELAGVLVEVAGVAVIVAGIIIASVRYLWRLRSVRATEAYAGYRVGLARSILLGLELLVAGDIIRTVVVAPTLENVGLLGLIVLIRTFLSFTLELEVTGKFPWHREQATQGDGDRQV